MTISPRDLHARGEAYPLPQNAAIFIDLMWLGNAMVFPAKPVPDSDRGAGIQTGSTGVPARILVPLVGTGYTPWSSGRPPKRNENSSASRR